MIDFIHLYKNEIKNYFNLSKEYEVFLYWKGRVALYAILKALGIKDGDEIIIPAFTCVVVPNAIQYCGARPIYVDINPNTLNIDVDKIQEKITARTKAIIAQNTFGLPPELTRLKKIVKENNLFLIDDNAHGVGSKYDDYFTGLDNEASFYSTQWNKVYSTGIGGVVITKNKEIIRSLDDLDKSALVPSSLEECQIKLQFILNEKLLNPSTYFYLLKIYRFLTMKKIISGSNQADEFSEIVMPKDYFKLMGKEQAKKGIVEIKKLDKNIFHRNNIYKKYIELFEAFGIYCFRIPDNYFSTCLKFPVLVKSKEKILQLAENNNLEIADWFLSPIHPIKNDLHKWNYESSSNPIAEKISEHIVGLPTHNKIDEKYFERLNLFIRNNRDEFLNEKIA